jgi:hypothetical protein
MAAGRGIDRFARQTRTPFLHKVQEIKVLIQSGLVPTPQFFAVEAIFCPRNRLEPVGRNLFAARLTFAVGAACDALERIIDLPEHATANARRCDVDVLFHTADGKLHFVSRLDSRKSLWSVSGPGQ